MLIFLCLLFNSAVASETNDNKEQNIIYKQKTEIDFDAIDIQGELIKPQGSLILNRGNAKFNPMIKLRRDFDDEMEKTINEIK